MLLMLLKIGSFMDVGHFMARKNGIPSEARAAVEDVFRRLPEHYRTEIIKAEIAEAVAQSDQHDRDGYDRAARAAVYAMFSSLDKALENRSKLANFSK
jgi:hypothetical protein